MEPFEQVDCVLSGMFTGTTVDFVDTTFRDRWIRYHNLLKLFSEKSPMYLAKIRKQIQAATGHPAHGSESLPAVSYDFDALEDAAEQD
ncbi:hypothetical protein SCLCIDRAFT_30588 [Scleroderma citrinum Foug A]|uniref:Uncharacterized protein n=1 Tax=Scleroderma citrinum Foug A TaxID=1036808 RepID=A0A0C2ZR48_9AGAM|nr:hypothetical protein SCLCIDRAFT_30588 [Scleroderma citrinum Foug A]